MSLSKSIFNRSENKFNEEFKWANRKSWLIKIGTLEYETWGKFMIGNCELNRITFYFNIDVKVMNFIGISWFSNFKTGMVNWT